MRDPWHALEEAHRATSLVYGPRTLRVLLIRSEAEARIGDPHAARVTLARAENLVNELSAAAAKRLDALGDRCKAEGAVRAAHCVTKHIP